MCTSSHLIYSRLTALLYEMSHFCVEGTYTALLCSQSCALPCPLEAEPCRPGGSPPAVSWGKQVRSVLLCLPLPPPCSVSGCGASQVAVPPPVPKVTRASRCCSSGPFSRPGRFSWHCFPRWSFFNKPFVPSQATAASCPELCPLPPQHPQ